MAGLTAGSLLTRQANVLLPDGTQQVQDILVRQGAIAEIATDIAPEDAPVIDASGLTLLPG